METLYSWSLRRSGASMTVSHSCGKLSGITSVEPDDDGLVIATQIQKGKPDRKFKLYVPTAN